MQSATFKWFIFSGDNLQRDPPSRGNYGETRLKEETHPVLIWFPVFSCRTGLVHGKETHPVEVTMGYLDSYMKYFAAAQRYTVEDVLLKGKMPALEVRMPTVVAAPPPAPPWPSPLMGNWPYQWMVHSCLLMAQW